MEGLSLYSSMPGLRLGRDGSDADILRYFGEPSMEDIMEEAAVNNNATPSVASGEGCGGKGGGWWCGWGGEWGESVELGLMSAEIRTEHEMEQSRLTIDY